MGSARKWFAALAGASLLGAGPAAAKDVCVRDTFQDVYVFKKVKSLKKPGSVAPLSGMQIAFMGGPVSPIAGTAVTLADGTVHFGVRVFAGPPIRVNDFTINLIGSADFAAEGLFDTAPDYIPSGPISWEPIDCKSVVVP